MRILAIDYGEVRIGIALSDALLMTAQSPSFIRGDSAAEPLKEIVKIARENDVTRIVLGLPKNMDGSLGAQANKVLAFGEALKEMFDGEIVFWDERLSSRAATRTLIEGGVRRKARKKLKDGVTAIILLQSYLDSLPAPAGQADE
jgi:putative Holliday junction resolvase